MKKTKSLLILPILFFLSVTTVLACTTNITPSPTLTLCDTEAAQDQDQCITPTVSPEVTETPTASPSAEVTNTPTVPPAGHGDGLSDGRSDGKSSCPECTQNHNVLPSGPPSTGHAR